MRTNGPNAPAPGADAHLAGFRDFLLRNRNTILLSTLLVLALTGLFITLSRPIFEGTTSLRIDEQRSNVPVLDILSALSTGSEINTEMEVLRSRTLAQSVVDSLHLQVELRRPRRVDRGELMQIVSVAPNVARDKILLEREANGFVIAGTDQRVLPGQVTSAKGVRFVLSEDARYHDEIELTVRPQVDAVRQFQRTVGIARPNREADLLMIRYESTDRELTRDVLNKMAELFIERRQDVQTATARNTVSFLSGQLRMLQTQLNTAENDVLRYREQYRLLSPKAEAEAEIGRLATLKAQRDVLESEERALAPLTQPSRQRPGTVADTVSRNLLGFPSLLRNPAASELLRSLNELGTKRAELLERRTAADPEVVVLTERIGALEHELAQIAATYRNSLAEQVGALDATLNQAGVKLAQLPERETHLARLQREASVLAEIYTLLQTRLKEAEIAAAVEDPSVRVIDAAILPYRPVKPNPPVSMLVALLGGIALGVALALARENLDSSVHTREDLHRATGGLALLGFIPRIPVHVGTEVQNGRNVLDRFRRVRELPIHARLIARRDPTSPVAEAYRSIRTNLTFSRPEKPPAMLVLTSPDPGEGKSTSAANLAITLAQQGVRCLLIDADLRRGALHALFGLQREPGLTNVLLSGSTGNTTVQQVVVGPDAVLDFIATGTVPPNPAELLGSARMQALAAQWRESYDTVIIDAPPLNRVTDAAVLASLADGVIMVARAGVTDRGALGFAVEQLRAVHAPLLGVVLNDVDESRDRYYGVYRAYTAHSAG